MARNWDLLAWPLGGSRMAWKTKCSLLRRPPGNSSSAFRRAVLAAEPRRCFPRGSALVGGVDWLSPGEGAPCGTSQQQDTHIGELGDIYYPWHPWHDHKVRVHATLVKRASRGPLPSGGCPHLPHARGAALDVGRRDLLSDAYRRVRYCGCGLPS